MLIGVVFFFYNLERTFSVSCALCLTQNGFYGSLIEPEMEKQYFLLFAFFIQIFVCSVK